jgi:lipopolysaccharide transport system ATP-binding protein
MGDVAIRADGLGKRYRIGEHRRYKALRDTLTNAFYEPFRFARSVFIGSEQANKEETIWALKDVSFEIKRGEVVGVIGRNGAGKSTLLKILSRITEPTEGFVDLYGRVGSLLEVGTGFHPELTGRENIYLNGSIIGMKKHEIDRKFDEIVAFAEIEKFLDTAVKFYSSGMHMRLAFAVAAHLEPELLLVDEVLAVGDAAFQTKCLGKMDEVAKTGRTVLFVSHNTAAIRRLCTNAIVLSAGHISFVGGVTDAMQCYLSDHAKRRGTVCTHITRCDPAITVESILINGCSSDELLLDETPSLEIQVSGMIHQSIRLDVEARFHDMSETPLAFFSPGHEIGSAEKLPAGAFTLTRTVALPKLMRGNYLLSLYLTDPDIIGWVDIPNAVLLRHEGTTLVCGRVIDLKEGKGWMLLPQAYRNVGEQHFDRKAGYNQN